MTRYKARKINLGRCILRYRGKCVRKDLAWSHQMLLPKARCRLTETRTVEITCQFASVDSVHLWRHTREKQRIAQAGVSHHQNRANDLVKIACQG